MKVEDAIWKVDFFAEFISKGWGRIKDRGYAHDPLSYDEMIKAGWELIQSCVDAKVAILTSRDVFSKQNKGGPYDDLADIGR